MEGYPLEESLVAEAGDDIGSSNGMLYGNADVKLGGYPLGE